MHVPTLSELLHQDVAQLTVEGEAVNGPDGLQTPAMSAGTCFDFNKSKQHLYLVGRWQQQQCVLEKYTVYGY